MWRVKCCVTTVTDQLVRPVDLDSFAAAAAVPDTKYKCKIEKKVAKYFKIKISKICSESFLHPGT